MGIAEKASQIAKTLRSARLELERLEAEEFLEIFVDVMVDEYPSAELKDALNLMESVEAVMGNCFHQSVFEEYQEDEPDGN